MNPEMFTCMLHTVNRLYASLDVPPEQIPCSQSCFGNYPTGHPVQCARPAGQVTVGQICVVVFFMTQSTRKCYFGENIEIYACKQAFFLFNSNIVLTSSPVYCYSCYWNLCKPL